MFTSVTRLARVVARVASRRRARAANDDDADVSADIACGGARVCVTGWATARVDV
jgi:hypothetical protein